MKRRTFIKQLSMAGTSGLFLSGFPVKAFALGPVLRSGLATSTNDRVLIFIQLHGGNDALNAVIPVNQYNEYYNYRPNIAIPAIGNRKYIELDNTLAIEDQVGLHPDMLSFKQMYDDGRAAIVQNVGYQNMNLSHFRGRDIMFMGGGAGDNFASGWLGRFLDVEYPGYPESYPTEDDTMQDPIALEIGNTQSLAFHRDNGIPIGFNVSSPQAFYNLINNVGKNYNGISIPNTHAGNELKYILDFEIKSNEYAERLRDVYDAGSNSSVTYPTTYPLNAPVSSLNNPLSGQLKLIARLLKGGIKTRVFMCRMGGFDTHGNQVESYDSTLGSHAALLYHLFSATKAFYDDLKQLGLEEKALSLTFTEFGRRVYSNASYGTDHGTATPVFLFGSGLKPGVYGTNPDLNDLSGGNIKYATDYRQIYAAIVKDWFEASDEAVEKAKFTEWVTNKVPILTDLGKEYKVNNGEPFHVFPNPVHDNLYIQFRLKTRAQVSVNLYSVEGKLLKQLMIGEFVNSFSTSQFNLSSLSNGVYVLQIQVNNKKYTHRLVK